MSLKSFHHTCSVIIAAIVTTALAVAFTALAAGCNNNDTTTTIITASGDPTPSSDPDPTLPDPTEGGTTDVGVTSTGPGGTTSDTSASTSSGSNSEGDTSTGPGDYACWPETMPEACREDGACDALFTCDAGMCSCATIAAKGANFCAVVHALAEEAGVTEPYLGFVDDMCTGGEDRCVVCFNLQNYCDLLAGSCDNLYTACGCVGDFYGTP